MPQRASKARKIAGDDLVAEDLARRRAVHPCGDELRAHFGFAEASEPARGRVPDASGERIQWAASGAVLGSAGVLGDVPVRPDLIERRHALRAAEIDDQRS